MLKASWALRASKAAMMPRPAQPTPGRGPPASTQRTPPLPSTTMSSSLSSDLCFVRRSESTVSIFAPPRRSAVESAFGSQPTSITLRPSCASASATFAAVVDLPMPPLP